jgi:hypothetical protein
MNYKILIGVIILTVFNIGLSVFIYKQTVEEAIPQDSRIVKLQTIIQKQFATENKSLIMNDSIADLLRNYTKDKTILILRFDKYSCSSCTDNAIADLLSFKDSIGSQNIFILFSTENKKDITLLKNQIKNSFNIISVKEGDINFEGISENLPLHFFMLDSQLKPFCIYFYAPEFSKLNRKYFNTVYQRFFEKGITGKVSITTVESEQTEIELKNLHAGKTSEAVFILKNTGTNPLVIQQVESSCGCTVPDWEKQPIAAGKTTEIKVRITPEEKEYFHKTITVHCNTESGQVSLKIKGVVED